MTQERDLSQIKRPAVALLANSYAPYLIHLCRRIATELTEVRFFTLFSHERTDAAWEFQPPPEISPVSFGAGESALDQARPGRALHEWKKGGRIIRWLRENRVRALIVAGYNDMGRLRVIRWCHRNGVACFVWADSNIHGDRATGLKALVKRAYVRRVMRRCAGAMPFGSLGRQYFEKYGVPSERIFLVPLEPDYTLLGEAAPTTTADEFLPARDRRRIIFSGRLVELKRLDLLLAAFEAIAPDRPQWDLVLVGDGPLRQSLQEAVPAALRSRVHWTGFVDDQRKLAGIYRRCDVLVLPSDRDAWALVINEAAAAGLAIVCTNVVGAAAELVRDGVNGYLFARGNGAELTDRLLRVTAPERIDDMKGASLEVLADWRRRADPVDGFRRALRHAGVLPSSAADGR